MAPKSPEVGTDVCFIDSFGHPHAAHVLRAYGPDGLTLDLAVGPPTGVQFIPNVSHGGSRREPTTWIVEDERRDPVVVAGVDAEAKVDDAKLEADAEAKVDAKLEADAEAKVDAKLEADAEAKVDAKLEADAEAKVDAKLEADAEAKVDAKLEADAEAKERADATARELAAERDPAP